MKTVTATLIALIASANVYAAGEDIKGIKLGMTKAEVALAVPGGTAGMTIGGMTSKYAPVDPVDYDPDGTVKSLMFFFDSKGFDGVLAALKEKYPALSCRTESVQNRMGAVFEQTHCHLGDLALTRYATALDKSLVAIRDWERVKREFDAEKKAKNGDV